MTKHISPYSPKVRARAVRMVFDHQGEHASQSAAISSIATTDEPPRRTRTGTLPNKERNVAR